jgi:hypothetical protein
MGKTATKPLRATIVRKSTKYIDLRIERENFEAFCNALGIYRKEFLELLEKSEQDSKAGRVTERKSLHELIKD